METKPIYLSKTLILNAIVAVLAIVSPTVSSYIANHPSEVAFAFSAINIVLRLVTNSKLELW